MVLSFIHTKNTFLFPLVPGVFGQIFIHRTLTEELVCAERVTRSLASCCRLTAANPSSQKRVKLRILQDLQLKEMRLWIGIVKVLLLSLVVTVSADEHSHKVCLALKCIALPVYSNIDILYVDEVTLSFRNHNVLICSIQQPQQHSPSPIIDYHHNSPYPTWKIRYTYTSLKFVRFLS